MKVSCGGRVSRAGSRPGIGAGIVSPAGVQRRCCHHIRPKRPFRCRSKLPCGGRRAVGAIGGAGSCPGIGAGIISAASVPIVQVSIRTTPDDHFAACPDCRV